MPDRNRAFSWPYITSAAVLLLGLVWIAWGIVRMGQRDQDLAEVALTRTIAVVRGDVQEAFGQVNKDLQLEGAFVAAHDSLSRDVLLERWNALFASRWPISAIRLADEQGNELAMIRDGGGTILRETSKGSEFGPPLVIHLPDDQPLDSATEVVIGDSMVDPRTENWYSRALEDRRGEPVWSLSTVRDSSGRADMIAALLIRPRHEGAPFRILAFMVSPGQVLATVHDADASGNARSVILTEDGRPLTSTTSAADHGSGPFAEAMKQWDPERSRRPQYLTVGGERLAMQVLPTNIGGVIMHVGTLINVGTLRSWLRPEWLFLWVTVALFAALLVLMVLVFLRNRRDLGRLKEQQKRSRTQQRKLAKVIGERDVLDREVHHRVKNNLQVLSSLLNLQAQRVDEGPSRDEFLRGKRRIDIMALVHQKLYGMPDLRGIDLERFFDELAGSVAAMYPKSRNVSYAFDTDHIRCDPDTAIELGIILCELMANCMQHAFPFVTGGHIDVSVRQVEGELYRLVVKDNGQGLSGEAAHRPGKLGLEIVDALAEKLDGTFKYRSNGGTTFDVLFRMLH
ncbi:MAG: sensor histidine kinase [Flavobacteriales bacterium]|nr:sensor histidine kinase [Flavobacteriales bacterium]MCB9167578.1 sensor histidine kinase [Flavobacteriales bacterium]